MNFIKSIWIKITQSWNDFWDSYQLAYDDACGIAPTGFYDSFIFSYPRCSLLTYTPDYYQTHKEVSQL